MGRIIAQDVDFSYHTEKVLKGLSLTIQENDFAYILGESGCGKSTFLRLLAGLQFPDSGSITVDGVPVQKPGMDRAVVFQDYGLYPWMTTGKNILICMKQKYPDKKNAELNEVIRYYLNQVGLDSSVYNKYPMELSGGMRQRCAICRAFAMDAPILLMDEPFGALDAVTRFRLQDMTLNLCSHEGKKKSVVFVTHDVEEAMYLSTKIFVLGMKPSKVIFTYEFKDKRLEPRDRVELFKQDEYVELQKNLMRVLNQNIRERIEEHEKKIVSTVSGR